MAKNDNLTDFLTDIANAIREKKGTTEKINPQNFATEIANLSSGGGSSGVEIATVSFYNYNGTLLYQKPTIKGDDCVDVVAKGLLAVPTKPSDNYNNYTYSGWSKENDNSVDSDILKNINEDINLYACYESSTRYYKVNFYSDGVLFDTVQVAYGETAIHKTIEKDGYKINGYEPSNENITADTDINIQWVIDDGLIHDDWDVISTYCEDGSYSTRYKVGDRKNLEINYADGTSETIPMRIVQLDSTYDKHTDDISKNAKLVFVADNALKDDEIKFFTSTSSYYWKDTNIYSYLNGDFLNYLPQTLQNVLVDVGVGTTSIAEGYEKGKVWIPSLKEVVDYKYYENSFFCIEPTQKELQYTEYSGEQVQVNPINYRTYKKVGSDEETVCWLRDTYYANGTKQHVIHSYQANISPRFTSYSTKEDYTNSMYFRGILIGFCIG